MSSGEQDRVCNYNMVSTARSAIGSPRFLFPSAHTLGKCPGTLGLHEYTSPQQRVPCAGQPVQRMRVGKGPRELPAGRFLEHSSCQQASVTLQALEAAGSCKNCWHEGPRNACVRDRHMQGAANRGCLCKVHVTETHKLLP